MELFDSHVHLDDGAFDEDREAVVARARAAGVVGMITVGTGVASSRGAVTLAERYPEVFAAVAIHPHDAQDATDQAMVELHALAGHPKVVAIGETGLDFVRESAPREVQRDAFRRHIRLSTVLRLPLIIHCREAYPQVLDILEEDFSGEVVMHAFSGTPEVARRCVDRGYAISVAGPVTYRNAGTLSTVAREAPLSHLLVETDAPVLTPEPFRGRRNEPSYLSHTVDRVAVLRDVAPEAVASATAENARRLFRVHST